MERIPDLVQIEPKETLLSAEQLTQFRHYETQARAGSQKNLVPSVEFAEEEMVELQSLYGELRHRLSSPRIERADSRTQAVWDAKAQAVRVLHKDGKFKNFGYTHDSQDYLEYYEALFLLELNRLHLEYCSIAVSLEQAYLLLLGEKASPKFNEYHVYSHFTRAGYILVKHRNVQVVQRAKRLAATRTDCIWGLLQSAVQNKPIAANIECSPYYVDIKESLERIKTCIMTQSSDTEFGTCTEQSVNFNRKLKASGKRKSNTLCESSSAKRLCNVARQQSNCSLIDILRGEPEYARLEAMFEQLDIIKLTEPTAVHSESNRHLHVNFDVHLHNTGFRKAAIPPPFCRIIILDGSEAFANHTEIALCHRKQLQSAPLLVASVSESKHIHAFLYYFS